MIAVFVLGVAVYLKFYAMTFSPLFEGLVSWGVKQLGIVKKHKSEKPGCFKNAARWRGGRSMKKKAETGGRASEKTSEETSEEAAEE